MVCADVDLGGASVVFGAVSIVVVVVVAVVEGVGILGRVFILVVVLCFHVCGFIRMRSHAVSHGCLLSLLSCYCMLFRVLLLLRCCF